MIGVFIDPAYRPPLFCGPAYRKVSAVSDLRLEKLDVALLGRVEKAGVYGIPIWDLLNRVADEQNPATRAEVRAMRLRLWQKLRKLLSRGAVFRRARKWVSLYQLPRASVNRRPRSLPGSTVKGQREPDRQADLKPLQTARFCQNASPTAAVSDAQSKSAQLEAEVVVKQLPEANTGGKWQNLPNPESVRKAATSLARLPRKRKRRWTGWIDGRHCWRNQDMLLPDGNRAFLYGVVRQQVVFTFDKGRLLGGFDGKPCRWGVIPARGVQIFKNPGAALLGSCKAGVKERKSEAKRLAAIANGAKPCRPGRRRGRRRSLQVVL